MLDLQIKTNEDKLIMQVLGPAQFNGVEFLLGETEMIDENEMQINYDVIKGQHRVAKNPDLFEKELGEFVLHILETEMKRNEANEPGTLTE